MTPRKSANCYIGPSARISGATKLEETTILSNPEEPAQVLGGGWVRSSLLQWGCRVDSMALVDGSVLTEHSHAERHGKVISSILGPNTGVAEGEVNASLLGPFVGFHHQSLLIAALWPEGKGNVAYGANVGSNHTSRAPDQEFWPGEGAYLGLGVNIKYPSDFTRAPYTIVAMGVSTLPQKLAFPFSLVNKPWGPAPGVSPAYNEIIPAWTVDQASGIESLFTPAAPRRRKSREGGGKVFPVHLLHQPERHGTRGPLEKIFRFCHLGTEVQLYLARR